MFKASDYYRLMKAKNLLSQFFDPPLLKINERDLIKISAQMTKEEIHPEVKEKLDQIAEHFSIKL